MRKYNFVDTAPIHVDDFDPKPVPQKILANFWNTAQLFHDKATYRLKIPIQSPNKSQVINKLFEFVERQQAIDEP